jgi:hypothetical protein
MNRRTPAFLATTTRSPTEKGAVAAVAADFDGVTVGVLDKALLVVLGVAVTVDDRALPVGRDGVLTTDGVAGAEIGDAASAMTTTLLAGVKSP